MLEGFGIVVAGQAGDPPSENAMQTGTSAAALVGHKGVASDAGAKHLCSGFAGKDSQRVVDSSFRRIERLTALRIPAADYAVSAAGQQYAAVRQKRHRPHRRARPSECALHASALTIDQRDRTVDARCGDTRAVA